MNHWDRHTFSYCFQFQNLTENPHLQMLKTLCCVSSMKHCFVLCYLVSLLLAPKPTVSFPLASIGFSIGLFNCKPARTSFNYSAILQFK